MTGFELLSSDSEATAQPTEPQPLFKFTLRRISQIFNLNGATISLVKDVCQYWSLPAFNKKSVPFSTTECCRKNAQSHLLFFAAKTCFKILMIR